MKWIFFLPCKCLFQKEVKIMQTMFTREKFLFHLIYCRVLYTSVFIIKIMRWPWGGVLLHFILRSYVLVSLGQLFKQSLAIVQQKPRSKPFSLCPMRDIPIYHKNICTRNIEELHCYSLKSMCTQYLIGKKTHPIKFLAPVDIPAAKDKHPIFSYQNISIKGGLKMILTPILLTICQ